MSEQNFLKSKSLPKDWTAKKIGDIFECIKSGGTPKRGKKEYWEDGTIPFVKIEDLNAQKGKGVSTAEEYTTEKAIEDNKTIIFNEGTILLTIYGTIGETALVKEPVSTNQGIIGLWYPIGTNTIYARYALDFEQRGLASKKRETTQANIGKEILKLHEIPHPPLPEQRKIATVLYNVDQAIQKTEDIIDQTERVKKGLMQNLVLKGVDHVGDIQELDESPVEDRDLVKLGEVMELEYGENLPEDERNDGEIPVYGSNGAVDMHDETYVEKEGIVIGRKGTIGKATYCNKPFWPIDTTYYITENETDLNVKFLYYLINSLQLDRLNAASAIPGLNRNDVYGLKALIPNECKQESIVKILENIDILVAKWQEEKEQLQRFKKGLIQDLLTGKVRTKDKDIEVLDEVKEYDT